MSKIDLSYIYNIKRDVCNCESCIMIYFLWQYYGQIYVFISFFKNN
jgi:hypothetical protein